MFAVKTFSIPEAIRYHYAGETVCVQGGVCHA